MPSAEFADRFAKSWIEAWNRHDFDAVLAHYHDDFEMRSPYIATVSGVASGVLQGKEAVGAYWKKALAHYSDLHFELSHVLVGTDSFMLVYHSIGGRLAAEVFYPGADGLIVRASAHYGTVA